MKNVLIVAYSFPPENIVGAFRPYRFYKFLPQFGYRPIVITASAQDESRPLDDVYHVPDPSSSGLRRVFGWNEFAPYLGLNRGLHWVRPAARAARALAERVPISAVISTVPPFNAHLVGCKIRRQREIPWIADFRDPLFFRPGSKLSVARMVTSHWERRFVRHADALVAVHDFMFDEWTKSYPRSAAKFHVLPNGFDPDIPVRPLPLPRRTHKVLVHSGSLYGKRTPKLVVSSLARLIRGGAVAPGALQLRLVGDAEEAVIAENADDVQLLRATGCLECIDKRVPRADALRELGEADYLLLLDNFAGSRMYGLPGKIFEYVRVGRPILAITQPDSPVESLLRKSGSRFRAIRPDSEPRAVDAEILALLGMPTDPVRPSSWFESEYDGVRQTGRLAALLDQVTTVKHSREELVTCAG
jgi:glycosyltransferase involved in cell wall biosynthesis